MTDMLKALQEKTKELNTGSHSAKTNLISKLNNLGVTKATSDLDLPELVQLIGFSAVEDKMPTILTLTADKTTVSSGDTVTLTATLTDVNGCPISGETVSILDGDDNVLYTGIIVTSNKLVYKYNFTNDITLKVENKTSTNYFSTDSNILNLTKYKIKTQIIYNGMSYSGTTGISTFIGYLKTIDNIILSNKIITNSTGKQEITDSNGFFSISSSKSKDTVVFNGDDEYSSCSYTYNAI